MDATNFLAINGSTQNTFTALSSSSSINFAAFNGGNEIKAVLLVQGTTVIVLGVLIPSTRPNYWDMNQWSWGFILSSNNFLNLKSTALNPFSNESFLILFPSSTLFAGANPVTNKRDILTGLLVASNTNNGIAGKTSDDIATVYGSGTSRYDTIQPTGTSIVYTILNNAAGGFALRTT